MDVDDKAGVVTGLEHLVELGHRRIAFVSAELPGNNPVREDAYVEFMRDRFGGVPEGYVQHVPNEPAGGETALLALLELRDPPTAIVTSTDLAAVGVLHAAYSAHRMVPDQLSVVGYDDLPIAAHTVPPLTTLRMPIGEMVGAGVRHAIEPGPPCRRQRAVADRGVQPDAGRPGVDGPAARPFVAACASGIQTRIPPSSRLPHAK